MRNAYRGVIVLALLAALVGIGTARAEGSIVAYLPLALQGQQSLVVTPTPEGPIEIVLDGPQPQHVLGSWAIDCEYTLTRCYYFAVAKYGGKFQNGIVFRVTAGSNRGEIIKEYRGGVDFVAQVGPGSGTLLRNGDLNVSFIAASESESGLTTGFHIFVDRIPGVEGVQPFWYAGRAAPEISVRSSG